MFRLTRIRRHTIGLRFRRGGLERVLTTGLHVAWGFARWFEERVDIVDLRTPAFTHPELDVLVRDPRLGNSLIVAELQEHERGLVWINGRLEGLIGPGLHAWWKGPAKVTVSRFDTRTPDFEHELKDVLVRDPRLAPHLTVVDLKDYERAILWVNGRVTEVLGPGLHAWWNVSSIVEVERFDVRTFRLEHGQLDAVTEAPGALRHIFSKRVAAHERTIVFRNGERVAELQPGAFVAWRDGSVLSTETVDVREQHLDVQGQDIITADKVSVRVNLLVTHRVTDPVAAIVEVEDWSSSLYREAQLELRAAVGGRTLEQLLTDKDVVGDEIRTRLTERAAGFGVQILSVGLRDIILPGDMKAMLNEVILAQKQAEANLIRRREETAAARSQVNTARLLAEHPALARMKELEALESILRGTNATFVLGSGDLTEQVGSLVRGKGSSPSSPSNSSPSSNSPTS
ncbi:MAG: slipin family protein [Phycisphaerales bacterium]